MTIQAQIIELLRGLQQFHNINYLFVSHDLRVVRATMSDEVAVMQDGRIVEAGQRLASLPPPTSLHQKPLCRSF